MRSNRIKKTLLISTVLLLAGASLVFARGGSWGDRGGHMMGPGYGMGPGAEYGYRGQGYPANLTDAQRAAVDAAREKFFNETETLRGELRQKHLALQAELAKTDPDPAVATQLQREISQLQSTFDEQRIRHRLEMRQLLPDEMGPRGYGRGFHRGGGYGGGYGYCWR
ncbi:Spy/CpxP family protein refolding chaperone [Desulfatitalea alkaliphila]|uniref:Periplasmic heavy metal sensor n=1 Tax=Desulfatitalea alkaliphila TaxID=2929485 RepID=A0AA41QZE0_9BACT|nr:periplasmic heavy metal sensor [Desulfatitalea alkaliphila]MCJ8499267.1 periplasmic heavy metal sensor [Desulfatitalea alkaliphila]